MKWVNAVLAAAVSVLLMAVLAAGVGILPAFGKALNPGAGVWGSAADAKPVGSRTVRIAGMAAAATVDFTADGTPTVHAASDDDLFLAQGYLQASFRLTQLDLERRLAYGRVAELVGPSGLESDQFEVRSGLARTAQAQWAAMPRQGPAAQALEAFSRGVNARLAELRKNRQWPSIFGLTGIYPRDWTPLDSLAVQQLLSQNLSYSTRPLDYALLRRGLGEDTTMKLFPVHAANPQRPYDPGPYRFLGVQKLPAGANTNAAVPGVGEKRGAGDRPAALGSAGKSAVAAEDILEVTDRLPKARIQTYPISNAWAANGPAVGGAGAILAGDPHLQLTLPSFWYQMALASPGVKAAGASLIGLPGIVIGHNEHISWSITDSQNQSTMFYTEQTSPQHPGQYYWNGAWRDVERTTHTVQVRGGKPVTFAVERTVHGPIMTQKGLTMSVSWMGNYVSPSLDAILGIDKAANYTQFRAALATWHSPTVNFTYADDGGNIAIVAAGYFPVVGAKQPWFPMSGTGENDIVGVIPAAATPQVYNPPSHVVATANQRPVGADYPYYIGTTLAAFDAGYRARRLYDVLENRTASLTDHDFQTLQTDVTDPLAEQIVPKLVSTLDPASLSTVERAALDQLRGWDAEMATESPAASIWWTFWDAYLKEVFGPLWSKITVDSAGVSTARASLNQDLEQWTLHDTDNAFFTPPGGARRDAGAAMLAAFRTAVTTLNSRLGTDPGTWKWGSVHTREVPSLLEAGPLGHAPEAAPGDRWTVNAAEGELSSSFGPSYRLVVAWTGTGKVQARSIYPGGQSENPAADWYQNLLPGWWAGRLQDLPSPAVTATSGVRWTLHPEGSR
jgi:penicillin amidase